MIATSESSIVGSELTLGALASAMEVEADCQHPTAIDTCSEEAWKVPKGGNEAGNEKEVTTESMLNAKKDFTTERAIEIEKTANDDGPDSHSNLVTWMGDDDPENPFNWPQSRKWLVTLITSGMSFMTMMSSTMLASSLNSIASDFGINTGVRTQLAFSSYVLAYAFIPMIISPLSEILGRCLILRIFNAWFLVWNIISGFANNEGLLIASRFLAGIGGGAIYGNSSGLLRDCWRPAERGKSVAIYNVIPLLGPAMGPLIGGFVTQSIGWRWLFWIVAIADSIVLALSLLVPETYHRRILFRRMQRLSATTGNPHLYTTWDHLDRLDERRLPTVIKDISSRAFLMLGKQPILQVVTFYGAYEYGVMFLIFSTFSDLWINRYGQTQSQSGLNYIAVAIGSGFASLVGGPVVDRLWQWFCDRHPEVGELGVPEWRVPFMIPGVILTPAALLWIGWSAEAKLSWIMPDIGIALFMIGITSCGQTMDVYLMEIYGERISSALAGEIFIRSLLAFIFPLFGDQLFRTLGYGWGASLLAFLCVFIGWPIPLVLWYFGAWIRKRSGLQTQHETAASA